MTDPLKCLRGATIGIAIWNIIYSLIQMGIMGWQTKEVRDRQWEFENRQLPATGAIDGFQARFPGLYAIYTETPERRRINAMFVIVLVNIFLAFVHFFVSIVLLYGAIKYHRNCIWPWFFSAGPIIIMSTAYAVMWWSGDVFNEQLTMSVAEFVMSLAVNGICLIIVLFFYWRLVGLLTSDKPAGSHRHRHRRREDPYIVQPSVSHPKGPLYVYTASPKSRPQKRASSARSGRTDPAAGAPPWRTEWPELPDPQLQRQLKRKRRSRSPHVSGVRRKDESSLDLYAPDAYDRDFPWKMEKMRRGRSEERPSHAETMERLYYKNNPDEVPGIPRGMRSSLRKERRRSQERGGVSRGRSPERVTFSRNEPASVHPRTPSVATPEKQSVV